MTKQELYDVIINGGGVIDCYHMESRPRYFVVNTMREIIGTEAALIDFKDLVQTGFVVYEENRTYKFPWGEDRRIYGKVFTIKRI